jgi:1-acyl-sn-glycerol-3-phosphate acyltransferase
LVGGNALVEMGTFVAILLGTIGAGVIMQFQAAAGIAAGVVVLVSVLGYLASRGIPQAPSDCPEIRISLDPVSSTLAIVRTIRGDRASFLAIAAISWFWFLGASYLTQFPNFTREVLGGDTSVVTLLLTVFTLGIGVGSLLCEKLSQARVELGIVPIGALGLTLFGFDLFLASPADPASQIGWLAFLEQPHAWRLILDLLGIGVSGGIFIVPLYAYIQQRAPAEFRARTIAVVNIMNALYMVGSAVGAIVLLGFMDLSIPHFFAVLAVMNLVICSYVFYKVDEFVIRFIAWALSHLMYRVRKQGLENLPAEGAAVMVCNHVSYVDAILLMGAAPRPVRFVMDHSIFRMPVLGWLFRTVNAIPIAPRHIDEKLYNESFERISASLREGNLVCIFPEGKLTKTGAINEFKTGVEKILERDPVPVIPMALMGLWGSFFSHKDGTALAKVPRRVWSRVTLKAAAPIAPEQATAVHLQKVVTEMVNG